MMSLAEFLSARRLSCAEFARTLGVRDTTVLRWARRDREPSVVWAFAIEKATDGLVPVSAWATPELSPSSTEARKVSAATSRKAVKGRGVKQAAAGQQASRKRRRPRKQPTH